MIFLNCDGKNNLVEFIFARHDYKMSLLKIYFFENWDYRNIHYEKFYFTNYNCKNPLN
jgi:hypothetical protein